jgi:hypothetical protein
MNRLIILVLLLGIIYCVHLYQQKLDRKYSIQQPQIAQPISQQQYVANQNQQLIEDNYTIDDFAFDNLSLMSTGSLDDIRKDVTRLHQMTHNNNNNFQEPISDEDTIMFSDISFNKN